MDTNFYKVINKTRLYRTYGEYNGGYILSEKSPDLLYGDLVATINDEKLISEILGNRYKYKKNSYMAVYVIKSMEKGIVKKRALHKSI